MCSSDLNTDFWVCSGLLGGGITHAESDVENHAVTTEMFRQWNGFMQFNKVCTAGNGSDLFLRIATATGLERLDPSVHAYIVILLASSRADEA